MIWGLGSTRERVLAVLACALASVILVPIPALAQTAPHVATGVDTDTCAMCHRTHVASTDAGWAATTSWEMTSSSLTYALPDGSGDTALCYVCHGIEALGSATRVQESFLATSAHALAPAASPYGPSRIECSSCHDSHGAAEISSGTPYPLLLRSRTSTGVPFYQAEEYCATCHYEDRALDTWDGLPAYRQTKHYTALPDPANGTRIRCSTCHVAHGSGIAPLIVTQIASPAVDPTATVTANDRTLCYVCHDASFGTYPGMTAYPSSAHAASAATIAVAGEWPLPGTSQRVGECQVCHAPMGSLDASGNLIPKMTELAGRAICDRCHNATGPASTDVSATAYPATAATDLELLAATSPTSTTAAQGRLAVYGTEPGAAVPRALVGPREYRVNGLSGDMTAGDINGDGRTEVLVAHTDGPTLTVLQPDALKGITSAKGPGEEAIAASAEFVLVADVADEVTGLDEVLALDADAGNLYVYRWNAGLSALALADGPIAVGASPTGIAAGDLDADGFAEVVVTDASTPQFTILTDDGAGGLSVSATVSTDVKAGPRGPSIGDVWDAAGVEIAVANSGETVDTVSVYSATGTLLGHKTVDADIAGGARAWDTLIADVLPGKAGAELAVAVNGAAGQSSINVFAQVAGGLDVPQRDDTGTGYATGSLSSGDIDADGRVELVVGNGGWWSRVVTEDQAPGVQVFNHDLGGNDLTAPVTLWSGGVELAGRAPALAVADLGGVGPTRHPVGAVTGAHVSTETPAFTRHVECTDCHDAHEATATAAPAPLVYGQLKGVFGASVTNTNPDTAITYGDAQPVVREFEVCFKCHSGYSSLEGGRNIASEVNTRNVSVHAVEGAYTAAAPASTFEAGWTNSTVLHCSDCHGNSDTAPGAIKGLHVSGDAPLLKRPYLGSRPDAATLLCYSCHKRTVYLTGAADDGTASLFYDADLAAPRLHSLHVQDHGFGCATCHVSHGSPTQDRLMRADAGYAVGASGGTCVNACHTAPGNTYTRP